MAERRLLSGVRASPSKLVPVLGGGWTDFDLMFRGPVMLRGESVMLVLPTSNEARVVSALSNGVLEMTLGRRDRVVLFWPIVESTIPGPIDVRGGFTMLGLILDKGG